MQPNIFSTAFPDKVAPTATPAPDNGVDPTIKALASTIGQLETGAPSPAAYTKKGLSGEYGRYQFMPDTQKNYFQKYVGDANAAPTVENQNKAVYGFIEDKKNQGYSPAQIMSMWNAGEKRPDAYKQNWRGTNSQGVAYDTPAYVQKGSQIYQQKKSALEMANIPAPQIAGDGSFLGDAENSLTDAGTRLSKAVSQGFSGQISPLSGLIQGAGAVASGFNGLTNNVLEHLPVVGGLVKGTENLIGQGAGKLAQTQTGQGLISDYQKFSQAHPELAGDINSGVDIASSLPLLKGAGIAKDAVSGGVKRALVGGVDSTLEAIAPKLTAKETAQALVSRGTVKKGILGTTHLADDPKMIDIANTVKENVPKFNPNKPLIKNITQVQSVVSKMSKDLKTAVVEQGANRIYPIKELGARLNSIERPVLISSDTTLNNAYNRVIKKALDIAKSKGGKVSNLLDVRQEFDQFVKRQFPNLYNSETLTPMRQAVKDIRNTITDFTAENLPDELGLKDSLLTQHKLLTAIENMSEKASSGVEKELGSNALTRLADRHPLVKGLVKTGAKAALEGTGIGAVLHLMQ